MNILVTGGFGLVGHSLKELIETSYQNDEVYTTIPEIQTTNNICIRWIFVGQKDGDLRKMNDARSVFERTRPNIVVHLAARVGGLFANSADNIGFFEDNVDINNNVYRLCREFKVRKCVSCLSTCIFPDKTSYPIDETMLHNGIPHHSNLGYSWAKRSVDIMNRVYSTPETLFTSVIPTNLYGKHDNFDVNKSHVIPSLLKKCYDAKQTNTPFVVFGSGKALRQFMYSKDLAKLLVWVVEEYEEKEGIILSVDPEDEVSIGDIARLIAKCMDFKGEIVFDTTKSDGQYKKTANNSKLRTYKKDYMFVGLEEGIKETCEWYISSSKSSPEIIPVIQPVLICQLCQSVMSVHNSYLCNECTDKLCPSTNEHSKTSSSSNIIINGINGTIYVKRYYRLTDNNYGLYSSQSEFIPNDDWHY